MNERMTFKATNEAGELIEYEVLFTFESDESKKNYIAYTDNTTDETGNTKVYASTYITEGEETKLLPIESEKEWKIIEKILEEIQSKVQSTVTDTENNE